MSKLAIIQQAPILLDKTATINKAVDLVAQAAAADCQTGYIS